MLTNFNDFQHLRHTGLIQLQTHRAYSSLTFIKTLRFFQWKVAFFVNKTSHIFYLAPFTVRKLKGKKTLIRDFFYFHFSFHLFFICATSFDENNIPFSSSSVLRCWSSRHGLRISLSWKTQLCLGWQAKSLWSHTGSSAVTAQRALAGSSKRALPTYALVTQIKNNPSYRWGLPKAHPPADISGLETTVMGRYQRS